MYSKIVISLIDNSELKFKEKYYINFLHQFFNTLKMCISMQLL